MKKLALAILLIIPLLTLGCGVSKADYDQLQTKYNNLLLENNRLERLNNNLANQTNELKAEMDKIQNAILPFSGAKNNTLILHNQINVKNPTYAELIRFIQSDKTDELEYNLNVRVCGDFATELHNNAELKGIRSAVVAVDFSWQDREIITSPDKTEILRDLSPSGHVINAFHTSDKGLVFIDCTKFDTVVYLKKGKPLGFIDIDYAKSLDYSFFEEYYQRIEQHQELVRKFNSMVRDYNARQWVNITELRWIENILDDIKREIGHDWYKPMGKVLNAEIHW